MSIISSKDEADWLGCHHGNVYLHFAVKIFSTICPLTGMHERRWLAQNIHIKIIINEDQCRLKQKAPPPHMAPPQPEHLPQKPFRDIQNTKISKKKSKIKVPPPPRMTSSAHSTAWSENGPEQTKTSLAESLRATNQNKEPPSPVTQLDERCSLKWLWRCCPLVVSRNIHKSLQDIQTDPLLTGGLTIIDWCKREASLWLVLCIDMSQFFNLKVNFAQETLPVCILLVSC